MFLAESPEPVFQYGKDFLLEESIPAVGGQVINVKGVFGEYEEVFLPLHGKRQAQNAALSLATAEVFLEGAIPETVIEDAFGQLSIPGRLEILSRRPVVFVVPPTPTKLILPLENLQRRRGGNRRRLRPSFVLVPWRPRSPVSARRAS